MKYDGKIDCPYCKYSGINFKFLREWTHGLHLVNELTCPSCQGTFRFYWGKKKDGSDFSYTIPKSINNK